MCREISKLHAETARGTIDEVLGHFKSKEVKGEIVVVLQGCGEVKSQKDD